MAKTTLIMMVKIVILGIIKKIMIAKITQRKSVVMIIKVVFILK